MDEFSEFASRLLVPCTYKGAFFLLLSEVMCMSERQRLQRFVKSLTTDELVYLLYQRHFIKHPKTLFPARYGPVFDLCFLKNIRNI